MGSRRSAPMMRWRSLAVLASLLAACDRNGGDLVLVGTVERTLIEMVAPVSETLTRLPASRGQRVRAGDVLAQLDPSVAEAEVAGAEARLAGARTGQATAANELQRVTGLRRARVSSEQDLERAQLAHDEAAARLREAQATLGAARHRLDELVLRAPVDGIVDQTPFDPGERVPAGGVVVVLLDAGVPWVRVWVPEQRASAMRLGLAAQVRIDGIATPLVGRVDDVAREPAFTPHFALTERDRVHLVYEARVALSDAPPELRPGLPAEVRIALEPAS